MMFSFCWIVVGLTGNGGGTSRWGGAPHWGHAAASVLTGLPHSLHEIKAINN